MEARLGQLGLAVATAERFRPVLLKVQMQQWQQHYLEGLSKHGLPGPIRVSDSAGLEWGLRICISTVFLETVGAAGPGATL